MWWAEVSAPGEAVLDWTREEGRWSVLVASVGPQAGPARVSLTWPQEVRTPWLLPGVLAGSVLLLLGLAWWTLILVATRGAGGPTAEPEVDTTGMTRRQLRELEERRAAARGRQPAVVSALGFLVPKQRPPRQDTPEHHAATGPTGHTPGGVAAVPPSASTFDDVRSESEPESEPRRRGLSRSSRGRRGQPTPPEPAPEPPGAPVPPVPPVPTVQPPDHAGAQPPRSSADAWRRTWGLVEDDDAARPAWRPVEGPHDDQPDGGHR